MWNRFLRFNKLLRVLWIVLVNLQADWVNLRADEVVLEIDGHKHELSGKIVLEGQDSSFLFLGRDGRYWFVEPSQVKSIIRHEEPPAPLSKKELRSELSQQLGESFRFHETKHYLIAYQTEANYARWVGGLFESRLYQGFDRFWKRRKMPLETPQFPLVVIIFDSEKKYTDFVQQEFGQVPSMVAYYNLLTNRIAMYDLTSIADSSPQGSADRRLQQILQNPAILPMISTIVHEGTHQLIFNRGLQKRFAESPLWLNEGLAVYFETPDPTNKNGWREPGMFNAMRFNDFQRSLSNRPVDALQQLIARDEPFNDDQTALAAYGEAWAFISFLLDQKSDQLVDFLKHASQKKLLMMDSPETRLAEFELFFGNDWEKLNREFLEYFSKIR